MKRAIPRVAAASLVLGGASCGDPTPTGPIADVTRVSCQAFRACEPSYFDEAYASLAQCTRLLARGLEYHLYDDYEYRYGNPITEACFDAYLDYLACYYGAYRDSCDPFAGQTVCTSERVAADTVCAF